MGIKIQNLRIKPYTAKDTIKVIFGDELHLSFEIAHVDGEKYLCALDNERILYPINRPVCAYTEVFTRNEGEVSFTLNLTTSKLRDYVSSIKKPMPVYIQIVRVVNGKYETVLLDDILAIPSVIDGSMTVYEGDSFKELLDAKMDIPEAEGTAGQVLTLDEDGNWTWQDLPEIPEQQQADWDESDSSAVTYIRNKPDLTINDGKITVNQGGVKKGEFTVNQSGDTVIDLNDGAQSDWDTSDSSDVSYIKHKPNLATVATSGSYNDLSNKPIITQPVNADWDESSSEELSYILNKPALATVATSGSYNDLTNKPEIPEAEDLTEYLCIETATGASTGGFGINVVGSVNASLEYSYDKETWATLTFNTVISGTNILGTKIYIRGDNSTLSTDLSNYLNFFANDVTVRASGNMMSLLSKDCSKFAVPSFAFNQFFKSCAGLLSAPELPATVVGEASYQGLFNSCTALVKAPELPAMTLGANAYNSMFTGCTALTKAPDLPAQTLAPYCYANMFGWCNKLGEAMGVLPATSLASYCYRQMFKQCKALKKSPLLPATTMVAHCYEEMFTDAGLTEVPALPAQELAEFCYGGMFSNNASLEKIPLNYLTATTLYANCYQWMFKGCTALKVGCRLPATTLASQCYAHMYDSCTALTDSERIGAETLANGCMNQMFKGCTNLCRVWVPNMTAFDESATPAWMSGLSNLRRAFVCNENLDVSTRNENRIPEGWIATRSAYTADAMVSKWNITANDFTFCPTNSEQDWIIVNGNLTLNAINLPSGYVGSAQAYVLWNSAITATITAGTGIDFVDTPRKGYLSHVLVTWEGLGNAKLRVMWESAL